MSFERTEVHVVAVTCDLCNRTSNELRKWYGPARKMKQHYAPSGWGTGEINGVTKHVCGVCLAGLGPPDGR
jgi:hypothetical protein